MSMYAQRLMQEGYYKAQAPAGQEPVFLYGSGGSTQFMGYKQIGTPAPDISGKVGYGEKKAASVYESFYKPEAVSQKQIQESHAIESQYYQKESKQFAPLGTPIFNKGQLTGIDTGTQSIALTPSQRTAYSSGQPVTFNVQSAPSSQPSYVSTPQGVIPSSQYVSSWTQPKQVSTKATTPFVSTITGMAITQSPEMPSKPIIFQGSGASIFTGSSSPIFYQDTSSFGGKLKNMAMTYGSETFWGDVTSTFFGAKGGAYATGVLPSPIGAAGKLFKPFADVIFPKMGYDVKDTGLAYSRTAMITLSPTGKETFNVPYFYQGKTGKQRAIESVMFNPDLTKPFEQTSYEYTKKGENIFSKYQAEVTSGKSTVEQVTPLYESDIGKLNIELGEKILIKSSFMKNMERINQPVVDIKTITETGALVAGSILAPVVTGTLLGIEGMSMTTAGAYEKNPLKIGMGITAIGFGVGGATSALGKEINIARMENVLQEPKYSIGEQVYTGKFFKQELIGVQTIGKDTAITNVGLEFRTPTPIGKIDLGLFETDVQGGLIIKVNIRDYLSGEPVTAISKNLFKGRATIIQKGENIFYNIGELRSVSNLGKIADYSIAGKSIVSKEGDFIFFKSGRITGAGINADVTKNLKITGIKNGVLNYQVTPDIKITGLGIFAPTEETGLVRVKSLGEGGITIIQKGGTPRGAFSGSEFYGGGKVNQVLIQDLTKNIGKSLTGMGTSLRGSAANQIIKTARQQFVSQNIIYSQIGGLGIRLPQEFAGTQLVTTGLLTKQVITPRVVTGQIGLQNKIQIGGLIEPKIKMFQDFSQIQRNVVSPISRIGLAPVRSLQTKMVQAPMLKNVISPQVVTTGLLTKQVITPRVVTGQITGTGFMTGFGLTPTPITPNTGFGGGGKFIPFLPKLGGFEDSGLGKGILKGKQPKRYTPSFTAWVLKIKGKQPKGTETGIRIRPITKGFKWSNLFK